MADEIVAPAAPNPAPEPVSAAPIVAPVVDAAPIVAPAAEVPVAQPVSTPEAKPEAAPVEASKPEAKPDDKPAEAKPAVELPKPEKSLLAEAGEEAKPQAEAKPDEVKPEAEVAPIPTYEAFQVPEGVTLDQKELGDFANMLGEMEVDSKADHRLMQDFGQKLLNKYIDQRKADAQQQMQTWIDTRKQWVDQVKKDPVYGRNRFETALRDAALVRDLFATPRFKEMIEYTGAGDHPGMMDFVHNIGKFLDRHGLLREGRPVAAPPTSAPSAKRGPRSRYQQPGA